MEHLTPRSFPAAVALLLYLLCPAASATHSPGLYLRNAQSLNEDWKYPVVPYETGYYDYRWVARDQADSPGGAHSSYPAEKYWSSGRATMLLGQ